MVLLMVVVLACMLLECRPPPRPTARGWRSIGHASRLRCSSVDRPDRQTERKTDQPAVGRWVGLGTHNHEWGQPHIQSVRRAFRKGKKEERRVCFPRVPSEPIRMPITASRKLRRRRFALGVPQHSSTLHFISHAHGRAPAAPAVRARRRPFGELDACAPRGWHRRARERGEARARRTRPQWRTGQRGR